MTDTASAVLVILLGVASTTQNHMAKALERQGIAVLDVIKARFSRGGARDVDQRAAAGGPALVYVIGLTLNHTVFVYHLLVAPLGGTTALYTSMYGVGLVVLLIYSTRVMKERLSQRELAGVVGILGGTLVIGIDGISRPALDMYQMDMNGTLTALAVLLVASVALLVSGLRIGSPRGIGLTFGLCAGALGTLDPFLKGVSQTSGGGRFTPGSAIGWVLLVSSFLIGELAFLITQWGFYRRARANLLVPALNSSYIGVPVVLQAILLPGYTLNAATVSGLALIMAGFLLVRGFGRGIQEGTADPAAAGAVTRGLGNE
jgi:drug/metabolite transporter (DMT)-like permease